MHKGSLFSTHSTTLVISCLFDNIYPNRCEGICHCGSDLHFSDISDVEHIFIYLFAIYEVNFAEDHGLKMSPHI